MLKFLNKIVEKVENLRTSFLFWAISFLSLIAMRLLVENWLSSFKNRSGIFFFFEFTHTLLFFLITYLLFLLFFTGFLKVTLARASNMLLLGFLLILTPPIIDQVLSGGQIYWSFYDFGGLHDLGIFFLNFFDNTPNMGITYGVRLEVFLAILLLSVYAFIKSKKISRAIFAGFFSYAVFFVLGTFPSWITIAVRGFSKGFLVIGEIDVVQLFLTPAKIFSREIPDIVSSLNIKMSLVYALLATALVFIGLFFYSRKKLFAFLKNARLPQMVYHGGFLLAGAGLGMLLNGKVVELNFINICAFLVLLIAVLSAWLASVVVNDFHDTAIDRETNPERPLIQGAFSPKEYQAIGAVLFIVSILFSAIVSFKAVFFIIAYQALAWIYSAWPLRLKRFAFISTFISAMATLMIFFSGYTLVSPAQNLENLPPSFIVLLLFGLTMALPIKDFKDIPGDKKEYVYTIPVLFGADWAKIIIGGGIFIAYLLSIPVLHEFRLFWWALLWGGASFWIINRMKDPAFGKSRIHYRNIFWWIMGVIIAYLVVLVKIIFL